MLFQLATVSRLLDEALDLSPDAIQQWFDTLPTRHRYLMPDLRALLDDTVPSTHQGFLARFPALNGPPVVIDRREGECVGSYRLLHRLGRGGTSDVWRAEPIDSPGTADVALKLPRHAGDDAAARCFANEAALHAGVRHPGIVRLIDAHVGSTDPYLALERVSGCPLDDWLSGSHVDLSARLSVLQQVSDAVAHLHEQGIVHRDLKPSNVLVTADESARLIDLGIGARCGGASVTSKAATTRSFTRGYAAPEQIRGAAPAPAADVYALGVLICEAVVGRPTVADARRLLRPAGAFSITDDDRFAGHLLDAAGRSAGCERVAALAGRLLDRDPDRRELSARGRG